MAFGSVQKHCYMHRRTTCPIACLACLRHFFGFRNEQAALQQGVPDFSLLFRRKSNRPSLLHGALHRSAHDGIPGCARTGGMAHRKKIVLGVKAEIGYPESRNSSHALPQNIPGYRLYLCFFHVKRYLRPPLKWSSDLSILQSGHNARYAPPSHARFAGLPSVGFPTPKPGHTAPLGRLQTVMEVDAFSATFSLQKYIFYQDTIFHFKLPVTSDCCNL